MIKYGLDGQAHWMKLLQLQENNLLLRHLPASKKDTGKADQQLYRSQCLQLAFTDAYPLQLHKCLAIQ